MERIDAPVADNDNEADEYFRIHVPTPDTELVLGKGPNGFIGIMGRVDDGGVFFGAGASAIPLGDSTYDGFKEAHTALSAGVSGVIALTHGIRTLLVSPFISGWPGIDVVINSAVLGGAVVTGGLAAAAGGKPSAEGNISLYGDSGIALASPISVTATGGATASLNAIASSINGVLSASSNGIFASTNGALAASTNGLFASVNGEVKTSVASRGGDVEVLGETVTIGMPGHIANPGKVTPPAFGGVGDTALLALFGHQKPTRTVDVAAEEQVAITAGTAPERAMGPSKVAVTGGTVRAETQTAAFTVQRGVTAHAGNAAVQLGPGAAALMFLPTAPRLASSAAIATADTTREQAYTMADDAYEKVTYADELKYGALVGLCLGGPLAAIPLADKNPLAKGLGGAGTPVGAALAGLATGGIIFGIKKLVAGVTAAGLKKAADIAHKAAVKAAVIAEETEVTLGRGLPTTAKVEAGPTGVTLQSGASSIKITPAGIIIDAPTVTIKAAAMVDSTAGITNLK